MFESLKRTAKLLGVTALTIALLSSCSGDNFALHPASPTEVPFHPTAALVLPTLAPTITQQPTLSPTERINYTPTSLPTVIITPTGPVSVSTMISTPELTATTTVAEYTKDQGAVGGEIEFGGRAWEVEDSGEDRWGPNNNLWREENVWRDQHGYLHLTVRKNEKGEWSSAAVLTPEAVGYGEYEIVIDNTDDQILNLDKNIVFGVFTWDNDSQDSGNEFNREIDIFEKARWGQEEVPQTNGETTLQPDLVEQFQIKPGQDELTFNMTWLKGYLLIEGPEATNGKRLTFEQRGKEVPTPGQARFIFNLWLHNLNGEELSGLPPSDNKEAEVIVKSFSYKSEKQKNK